MESLKKRHVLFDMMSNDSVAGAWIPDVTHRHNQIEQEIDSTDLLTYKELVYGSKPAWRNSNRCIGRHFWRTLQVNDARLCASESEVVHHLKRHIQSAFNGGQIANVITIFPPSRPGEEHPWRLLNHQLIRYAGFRQQDQEDILGDPDSVDLTEYCQNQGWHFPLAPNGHLFLGSL